MIEEIMNASDGCQIKYAYSHSGKNNPWLVLILPFGLKNNLAKEFFSHFSDTYNIATWESRHILAPEGHQVTEGEMACEKHLSDLNELLDLLDIKTASLIGYCSGAGIAMAATAADTFCFENLLLIHGEYVLLKQRSCITQIGLDIDSILPMASASLADATYIFEKVCSSQDKKVADLPEHIDINLPFSQPYYFYRYAMNYLSYRAMDFQSIAANINTRTFLITGEQDKHTNADSSKFINDYIKNSEIYIDSDADHYGILRPNSNTLSKIEDILDKEVSYEYH
ncbi:hypothetical protein [Aliiglaciecola sp. LCG003]|uniref:hypothetical protein n=1 Tax=Aliiglaciecola sp. LCG003 TaxID=3053655 RepID=UPI002574011F|nr:hypothetical protein [Aliiglaciecola sp. LCG003]WJG11189.1 hypothetical protein QR722_09215 [Aliiglaciecola sp. LCG003]